MPSASGSFSHTRSASFSAIQSSARNSTLQPTPTTSAGRTNGTRARADTAGGGGGSISVCVLTAPP